MKVSLELLRAGGSSYTVEEIEHGFLLHVVPGDEANFNIIIRRLMTEAGDDFVVFPRTDGKGGYDCAHIMPHDLKTAGPATIEPSGAARPASAEQS